MLGHYLPSYCGVILLIWKQTCTITWIISQSLINLGVSEYPHKRIERLKNDEVLRNPINFRLQTRMWVLLGERGKLEGGESNIRLIKGAAYMRERERESIRLIAVRVRTSSVCATVLPQKRSAASARASPESSVANLLNTFITSRHRSQSSFLWHQ